VKIFVFLFLFCGFAYGDINLKIATYNVENLFDLQKNGNEYPEYVPNTQANWNQKTYKIKLQNIAKVIKDINADIIALQEIESLQALKDLRFALKQSGVYYQYYKIADSKNTTVKVALLSKQQFAYAKEIAVTSSYAYRNILEAKFTVNGQDLYVLVNHWKAKSGPESMRIVSAKKVRRRIEELGHEKNVIVLGDFNSDYEEYKLFKRIRKHNDTNGRTGINDVLRTKSQISKASKVNYEKNSLYNLWYDAEEDQRYTYIFRGKKEAMDSVVISQSLLNQKDAYYRYDSIASYKPKYLFKGKQIYRWATTRKKPHRNKGKGYSDHLAVSAEFVVSSSANQ
jgi:endonuclease/exonuclease/phosphatase family metal-dependent hydrolase